MPKALIYCRVSSERQVNEGHGLEGQELRCRGFAEQRGYEVVKTFRDEGISGGVIDREGMQKLLDYLCTNGKKDEYIVIIDDIKRLARDVLTHITLRRAIQKYGAKIESPSHRFGDEPEDNFHETLMAAIAELERHQNKRQVRNRMKARLEAGYWTFYQPPGYTYIKDPIHGKLIVPKEPEASIIREALEGFASSRFATQMDVKEFLDAKGFNHWGTAKHAYLEQVKRLLTREVYAGYIIYPKWNVTRRIGHHQALIDPETFQRIQDRLAEKEKLPRRKDINADFPLRGFVVCSCCHKPLTSGWSTGRRQKFAYYWCRGIDCQVKNKMIRADKMHKEFEAMLSEYQPNEKILDVVKTRLVERWKERMISVGTVRKERQKKLDGIQKEIDQCMQKIKLCQNMTVLKKLEEEIDTLEAKQLRLGGKIKKVSSKNYDFDAAVDRVFAFIKNPLAMWREGNLARQRLVLRLVFEKALVYERGRGFEHPELSLPIAIACTTGRNLKYVVEMPGVEPGSNVYHEGLYDHVVLSSSPSLENSREKGGSDDA